ncbi:MAG: hypothetical protein G8237_15105 [Magnetococcales bacterium]|nr:hypothetical protein [Magnetococcales bacterium]
MTSSRTFSLLCAAPVGLWKRYPGLLLFSLVLGGFLVLQALLVISGQYHNLYRMHRERVQHELDLISMVAYESILRSEYAILERVFQSWGEGNPDLVRIHAAAPNGFVLARYQAAGSPESATLPLVRVLRNRDEPLLEISIEYSLHRVEQEIVRLSVQLGVLSVLLMVMLGGVLWVILRMTAVRPLEQEVGRRRAAEDALHHLNEELEQRVERRTRELKESLQALSVARDRLYQAEKMASLGRLVAGIAHEINTPVGIGYTAASFLEDRTRLALERLQAGVLSAEEWALYMNAAQEATRMILTNLERAVQLIRSFKQVAVDPSTEGCRNIVLSEHVQLIVSSLRPKFRGTRHQITVDCPVELEIHGSPSALFQILSNLIMNSLRHGFEGMEQGSMHVQVVLDPSDTVVLHYRDNGKGIVEADRVRIFEPFFTTRLGQGGSGLGLYIVYNLVTHAMGGSIACQSVPGEGTEFWIRFPRQMAAQSGIITC